jgi:hypothetical protein
MPRWFSRLPVLLAAVSDSGLQREFQTANAGAVKALEDIAAWFGDQAKSGTNDYALGAELDAGNARQQAARGTYDPGYLNYTLGKLMIRKLREDWSATRGGQKAWHDFHDQFLSFGGPPIPL